MATGFYGKDPGIYKDEFAVGFRGGGRQFVFTVPLVKMEMYDLIWDDFRNTYTQTEFTEMLSGLDKVHFIDCECGNHPITGDRFIHWFEAKHGGNFKSLVRG